MLVEELEGLKGSTDLIQVEVKMPDGQVVNMHIAHSVLAKWAPDEVVIKARQTRGRVPGSRMS